MRLSESQQTKVNRALEIHEKYKSAYFWNKLGNASSRRYQEKRDSIEIEFKNGGHVYKFKSDVTLSCRNAYYNGYFYLDGKRKDVRLFKSLQDEYSIYY